MGATIPGNSGNEILMALLRELDRIVSKWLPKSICKGGETDIFRWLLLPERWTGAEFERQRLLTAFRSAVRIVSP